MKVRTIYVSPSEYGDISEVMKRDQQPPNISDYQRIFGKHDPRIANIASYAHHDIPMQVVIQDQLHLGMESSNLESFVSRCCNCGLSVEPLSRIACGECGKTVDDDNVIQLTATKP